MMPLLFIWRKFPTDRWKHVNPALSESRNCGLVEGNGSAQTNRVFSSLRKRISAVLMPTKMTKGQGFGLPQGYVARFPCQLALKSFSYTRTVSTPLWWQKSIKLWGISLCFAHPPCSVSDRTCASGPVPRLLLGHPAHGQIIQSSRGALTLGDIAAQKIFPNISCKRCICTFFASWGAGLFQDSCVTSVLPLLSSACSALPSVRQDALWFLSLLLECGFYSLFGVGCVHGVLFR